MTNINTLEVEGKILWIKTDNPTFKSKENMEKIMTLFKELGALTVLITDSSFDIKDLDDETLTKLGLKRI